MTATTLALVLAGGEHHGPSLQIEGFYAINFVLFIGILVYYLRKPLSELAATRKKKIMADIDEARRLRQEAEKTLAEYEARLANLEAEMHDIVAEAKRIAEHEKQRVLAEAVLAAERLRQDAKSRIDGERFRLEQELKKKAAELALEIADRLVRERMTETHRKQMVASFVTEVEKMEGTL